MSNPLVIDLTKNCDDDKGTAKRPLQVVVVMDDDHMPVRRQRRRIVPSLFPAWENVVVVEEIGVLVQEAAIQSRNHHDSMVAITTTVPFFLQQLDSWSCGFRTLQIVLGALGQTGNQVKMVPTLLQLQHTLEDAWKAGLDPKGADFYHRTLAGTCQKIGAVEALTILHRMHINACVVQFIRTPTSRKMLKTFCQRYFQQKQYCPCQYSSASELARAVLQGPGPPNKSCQCPILPLYLQWEGHAVTVIGHERTKDNADYLWVLDSASKHMSKLTDCRRLRKSCAHFLERRDCQILLATHNSLSTDATDLSIVTAALK